MEAAALGQQVDTISRSLAPSPEAVTDEHRTLALSTLVELRRLEQLRAIAESKSNSTYFFGDKSALGVGTNDAFSVDYAQNVKTGLEKRGDVKQGGVASVGV